MKKLISILLALIMLMALAVPAMAVVGLQGELSGDKTYNEMVKINNATVTSGTDLIFNGKVNITQAYTLTVESNASITTNQSLTISGNLTVKSGGTVTANEAMNLLGNLTVEPGGTFTFSDSLGIGINSTVEIGGTLSGKWGGDSYLSNITLLESGKIEAKFKYEEKANAFAEDWSKYKKTITEINDGDYKYLVTVEGHIHDFTSGKCKCGELCSHYQGFTADGKCVICSWQCPHEEWNDGLCEKCGYACKHNTEHLKKVIYAEREYCPDCDKTLSLNEIETTAAGSTLSEGNMTIVVGVAAAVIFGLGGFVLGRRKKA